MEQFCRPEILKLECVAEEIAKKKKKFYFPYLTSRDIENVLCQFEKDCILGIQMEFYYVAHPLSSVYCITRHSPVM